VTDIRSICDDDNAIAARLIRRRWWNLGVRSQSPTSLHLVSFAAV